MPHNVERMPRWFKRYPYRGWDARGSMWRIHKDRTSSIWWAYCEDAPHVLHAFRLRDLASKLSAQGAPAAKGLDL
jgi:hypothetical protein